MQDRLIIAKAYYERHKEEILAKRKSYYVENREKLIERVKTGQQKRRDGIPPRTVMTPEERAAKERASRNKYRRSDKYRQRVREAYQERKGDPIQRAKACAAAKKWREAHPERAKRMSRESASRWYHSHLNEARRKSRESASRWYHSHPEERRRWIDANPERWRALQRKQRLKRRAVLPGDIYAFSLYCEEHATECVFCGEGWEDIEHLTPICKGGTNAFDNLAPSCAKCNRGRGGKHRMTLEEFAASGKMKDSLPMVIERISRFQGEFKESCM